MQLMLVMTLARLVEKGVLYFMIAEWCLAGGTMNYNIYACW